MKKCLWLLLLVSAMAHAEVPLNFPTPLQICDDNTDSFSVFNLTQKNAEILSPLDEALYSVQYFETNADAQANTNAIGNPGSYENLVNPQTLFVRVTELANTANIGFTTLTIRVLPSPVVPVLSAHSICDDNGDGLGTFDLTMANAAIEAANFPTNVTIEYYETIPDALAGTNPLPAVYTTIVPGVQTVYVRATNPNGCYSPNVASLVLIVGITPTAPVLPDMTVYQNPYTGVAAFNFLEQRFVAMDANPGAFVLFFPTQADAEAHTNNLSTTCYQNTAATETIWAGIYSTQNNGCYVVTSFDIHVVAGENPSPILAFADPDFEAKLLEADTTNPIAKNGCLQNMKIDINSDGHIQANEAARVSRLNISGSNVSDLDGIQNFSLMEILDCSNNQLESLNLDGLYWLGQVNCGANLLTSLDFSQTHIFSLHCYNNDLVSVNIKNNTEHELPAEIPGNWQGNPNLETVCVDDFELETIELLLGINGYEDVTITSDCSLGVPNNPIAAGFLMYPNPANEMVNIKSAESVQSVRIFDAGGRIVATYKPESNEFSLDVSAFSQGLYFLKATTENGSITQKLMIGN